MTKRNDLFQLFGGLFAIALLILFLLHVDKPTENSKISNKRYCITEKKKLLRGVIVREYYSRRVIFVLNDSSLFAPQCLRIVRRLSIGDSIYKPSGTFDCYIYKKANPDSVFFLKCDFDCNLYNTEIDK